MLVEQYQLLIADDDDAFRETLCEIFEPFFRLIEAESGEKALELASREDVHLALFDMHMQRLTGLEALRQLKEIHIIAPCILITADYTSETLRRRRGSARFHGSQETDHETRISKNGRNGRRECVS